MFTVESEGISMKKGINQSNVFLTIAIVCTLLTVSILPVILATDPVIPLQQYLWIILALVLIIILLITARLLGRKQRSRQ